MPKRGYRENNPITGRKRRAFQSTAYSRSQKDSKRETQPRKKSYDKAWQSKNRLRYAKKRAEWWAKYGSKGIKKTGGVGAAKKAAAPTTLKKTDTKPKASPAKTTAKVAKKPVLKRPKSISKTTIIRDRKNLKRSKKIGKEVAKTGKDIEITENLTKAGITGKQPNAKTLTKAIKKSGKDKSIKKKNRLSKPEEIQKVRSEISRANRPKKGEVGYRSDRPNIPRQGIGEKAIKLKTAVKTSKKYPEPDNLIDVNKTRVDAGLEPLKTNKQIVADLDAEIKKGTVRAFKKPTRTGAGLNKAGATDPGTARPSKIGDRGREPVGGAGLLVNAKKLSKEAYNFDENTYKEILSARLNNRNQFAKQNKIALQDARSARSKKFANQESTESTKFAKQERRKLSTKINNPRTSKPSRDKAINDLNELDATYPNIRRSNASNADDLAKKYGTKLKQLKTIETPDAKYRRLASDIELRYAEGNPLKVGGAPVSKATALTIVKDKVGVSDGIAKEVQDEFKALQKLNENDVLEQTLLTRRGSVIGSKGKRTGVTKLESKAPETIDGVHIEGYNVYDARIGGNPGKEKRAVTDFLKPRTDRLNKSLQDRVGSPGFKAGRTVTQGEAARYNRADVRTIRNSDGTIGYVIKKGARKSPYPEPSVENPLLRSGRRGGDRAQDYTFQKVDAAKATGKTFGGTVIKGKKGTLNEKIARGLKQRSNSTELRKAGFKDLKNIPSGYKMKRIKKSEFIKLGPKNAFFFSSGTTGFRGPTHYVKLIKIGT